MKKLLSHCPVCKKPTEEQFWPFCSARCKEIDLGRWFTETYTIPVEGEEPDEDVANTEEERN